MRRKAVTNVLKKVLMLMVALCALFAVAHAETDYGILLDGNAAILPEALSRIEESAFEGADFGIVILPDGLTEIGDRAFAENARLHVLIIPESVIVIGEGAFDGTERMMVLGDPNSAAEDWARVNGFSFVDRGLLMPIHLSGKSAIPFIPIIFIIPLTEEEREKIARRLRNVRSLRRQDRPEMNIPECAVP